MLLPESVFLFMEPKNELGEHRGSKQASLFVCLFLFFRAILVVYGGSQARGPIGAVAAGLHHCHTTWDLSHVCNRHHSSRQHRIFNPLNKARDRTRTMIPRWTVSAAPRWNSLKAEFFLKKICFYVLILKDLEGMFLNYANKWKTCKTKYCCSNLVSEKKRIYAHRYVHLNKELQTVIWLLLLRAETMGFASLLFTSCSSIL